MMGLLRKMDVGRRKTPNEVIDHKNAPASKRRYERAFANLAKDGPKEGHDRVAAFVKCEKWPESSLLVKPPRLIQYRSFEFCAELSTWVLAIEEELWKSTKGGVPIFAKGMNSFAVAKMMVDAMSQYEDPVFVLADHSKFDSCVMRRWKRALKKFFVAAFPGEERLGELLDMMMSNRAWTKSGVKYTCTAREMSGEYTTSVDANLVNYSVLSDVFRFVRHHSGLNGDDSWTVLERRDLAKVDLSPSVWKRYGFKTTWKVVDVLEEVEFCQCQPVEIREGLWRMVRTPRRAISRSMISVKRYQGEAWKRLVRSMGMSELACADGVPVLQAWGDAMLRAAGPVKELDREISYRARLESTLRPAVVNVTEVARASFERAFDMDADEQRYIESWLASVTMRVVPYDAGI